MGVDIWGFEIRRLPPKQGSSLRGRQSHSKATGGKAAVWGTDRATVRPLPPRQGHRVREKERDMGWAWGWGEAVFGTLCAVV